MEPTLGWGPHLGTGCVRSMQAQDVMANSQQRFHGGLQTGEGLLTKQCRCSLRAQRSECRAGTLQVADH